MKEMVFLDNPRGKRSRVAGRGHQRRKTRRKPPKGFSTWSAYMASIRPNGTKRRKRRAAASSSTGATSMAHKRRGTHRRRHASRAHARTHTHHRRHVRRNPRGFRLPSLSGVVPFAIEATTNAAAAIGGKVVARKARGLAGQAPGEVVGSAIELGVGLVGGLLLRGFHRRLGTMFATGAIMAAGETALQRMNIPHISDSLGDDGFMVGPGTGVTLVSAHPDDYQQLADGGMGRYVDGDVVPVIPAVASLGRYADE